MKKMMVALVGIVSVLMLASCEKVTEVEIVGDSTVSNYYEYRMVVTGTASYVPAEWDSATETYKAKSDEKSVELVTNVGWISWGDIYSDHKNQKEYYINAWYDGKTNKARLDLDNAFDLDKLFEYKEEFYLGWVGSDRKVTVTGSPKDDSFSVKVSNFPATRYGENVLLTFDLTFSR